MMALLIINVHIGKALDLHPDLQLSRTECKAAGDGSVVEEFGYICHFHLASVIETELASFSPVTLLEEPSCSPDPTGSEAPEIRSYGLRAPPVLS